MRTVAQAAREAARTNVIPPTNYSHFLTDATLLEAPAKPVARRAREGVRIIPSCSRKALGGTVSRRADGSRVRRFVGTFRKNLTTDTASGYTNRRDFQAKAMGMGPSFAFASASGNATATTATTLTNSGATFPTAGQGLAGCIVFAGPNNSGTGSRAYGVIVSNTGTALTVDQWYDPTSTSGAVGTTPNATANYVIAPGQNPAAWLALTSDSAAAAATDTTLASEATTNGFARKVGTFSHTAAASTFALSTTFNATGSLTVNKEAVFGAANPTGGGVMPFESAETSPPTLINGDTLTQTVTITIN